MPDIDDWNEATGDTAIECSQCGKWITADDEGHPLCDTCWRTLQAHGRVIRNQREYDDEQRDMARPDTGRAIW